MAIILLLQGKQAIKEIGRTSAAMTSASQVYILSAMSHRRILTLACTEQCTLTWRNP